MVIAYNGNEDAIKAAENAKQGSQGADRAAPRFQEPYFEPEHERKDQQFQAQRFWRKDSKRSVERAKEESDWAKEAKDGESEQDRCDQHPAQYRIGGIGRPVSSLRH